MGWVPDEEHGAFFRWKHRENPQGESPAWVAADGEKVVGYRTFVRWQFDYGGEKLAAVRAVDTATHPEYQGQGIFTQLTQHALSALEDEGVDLIFNTPNERSLPGYLKLGWQEVGRLPASFRPRSLGSLLKVARARTPASKWSEPTTAGLAAADVLGDSELAASVASVASAAAFPGSPSELTVRTARSQEHLVWRYGFRPLDYRIVQWTDSDITDGLVIFRLRRRGPALEAAVCEVLLPALGKISRRRGRVRLVDAGDANRRRRLLTKVLRTSGADYAVVLSPGSAASRTTVPLPGQGPTLVWRPIGPRLSQPPAAWRLTLGDIELF